MTEDTTTTTPPADTPAVDATSAAPVALPKKKKSKRSVPFGQIHILATFNNTIISVTDPNGGLLATASAGGCGFRGSKKGTAYAAQIAAEKAISAAKQAHGLTKADVFIKGIGLGREAAIRAASSANVSVEIIKDMTGLAHGGCRPKKARRV
jgi:small subunit ribosomal protein S11